MKPLTQYCPSELHTLGWITIVDVGEENIYFTLANGQQGYAKIDGYQPDERSEGEHYAGTELRRTFSENA